MSHSVSLQNRLRVSCICIGSLTSIPAKGALFVHQRKVSAIFAALAQNDNATKRHDGSKGEVLAAYSSTTRAATTMKQTSSEINFKSSKFEYFPDENFKLLEFDFCG
jgi:hypothetical protein